MNLYHEFKQVVSALEANGVEYALCGGLAMAVYSSPRATMDVDLLIQAKDLERVKACSKAMGFCVDTGFLKTVGDKVSIYRMVKPVSCDEEPIILDLVIVNDALENVWNGRERLPWDDGSLSIVSKVGLAKMKMLRGSGRDLDDVDFLQDSDES
ncbi:MAG: nucleotidyltransferase family protein [Kiritimatiellales bacterium]|nr:nucleotidyltransferase family protein [Kiritimatiellales bacterium]MCF7863985.1 nucleotidyltransferase family protein [Kiritimatiellales bacterium]